MRTLEKGLTLGRELYLAQSRPRRNFASPELGFSQLPHQQLPVNPAGSHSDNCANPSLYDYMPRGRFDQSLGRNLRLAQARPCPR